MYCVVLQWCYLVCLEQVQLAIITLRSVQQAQNPDYMHACVGSRLQAIFYMSIIYPDTSIMKKLFLQFSSKHIKLSQFGHSSKRIFSKKLSASGGRSPPDPPTSGSAPWTSAGGSTPDPRYRLALPRSPWEPEPPFHKSCLHP